MVTMILLAWLVLSALYIGAGALAYRLFGLPIARAEDLFRSFWVGWTFMIFCAQVWNFWFPIDEPFLLLPVLVGAIGWLVSGRPLFGLPVRLIKAHRLPALLLGVLVLWAAIYSAIPLTLYDAGLYHVSSIRWANSYPVVPGLGNLYGPLASNSSFFLYLAMLNTGPLDGQGHHIGVGLLMVTLLAQMGISAWRVTQRSADAPAGPVDYFLALLIAPALVISAPGFSTTATDYPVFILPILVSAQLLTLLCGDTAGRRETLFSVFFITLIASAAVTMKLSLAVFGSLSVLTALAVAAVRYRSNWAYLAAALLVAVGVASLLLFPWLARGVVLSGYPLYPSTFAPAPVEWRVPEAALRREMGYMIGLARRSDPNYAESTGNWDWLGPWFALRWPEFFPPLVIGLAAPIAAWLLGRREAGLPRTAWLSLLPCWLAIVGWFFAVPWPRYISSLFWIAGAGAVALVLPSLRLPARSLLIALLCAAAMIPSVPSLTLLVRIPVAIVRGRWVSVDDMPKVPLNVFTTSSGLEVHIPANAEDLPWDAPLPSAPWAPDTDPRLRRPGSLRGGFIAEQSPQGPISLLTSSPGENGVIP